MLFRRYGTFSGGIDLPDEKQLTRDQPIEPYRPRGAVRVPLAPCRGRPAEPIVEPGQVVSAGEKIASATAGVDVFAPVAGTVRAFCQVRVAAEHVFSACPAVEIEPADQPFLPSDAREVFDWQAAGAAAVRERIAAGGLSTHRRPAEPLTEWIDRARSKRCLTLVANVMEGQPYVTADHRLLVEHGPQVLPGLAILGRAIEAQELILAAESRRTGDYQQLAEPGHTCHVERVALPHKYPIGADPILVKVLTRREVPPGGSPMDVGCAVVDAATCFAIYRWVVLGLPPTGRVVTVSGPRAARTGNFFVPFGVSCAELLGEAEALGVHNGPMVGLCWPDDAVVCPTTNAVLAMEPAPLAAPSQCIRCAWCTDHCPARLNVAALNDAFELGRLTQARRLVAPACVECGVCSYVCPARLPLSQRVRQLKRTILDVERSMPLFAGG